MSDTAHNCEHMFRHIKSRAWCRFSRPDFSIPLRIKARASLGSAVLQVLMGVAYLDTCRGILCGMSHRMYTRSWKREHRGEKQTMRMKWEKRGEEDATHYIIVGSWHSSRARGSLIHARNSHESHEATRLRARSHGASSTTLCSETNAAPRGKWVSAPWIFR